MRTCPQCGETGAADAVFCEGCGARLPGGPPAASTGPAGQTTGEPGADRPGTGGPDAAEPETGEDAGRADGAQSPGQAGGLQGPASGEEARPGESRTGEENPPRGLRAALARARGTFPGRRNGRPERGHRDEAAVQADSAAAAQQAGGPGVARALPESGTGQGAGVPGDAGDVHGSGAPGTWPKVTASWATPEAAPVPDPPPWGGPVPWIPVPASAGGMPPGPIPDWGTDPAVAAPDWGYDPTRPPPPVAPAPTAPPAPPARPCPACGGPIAADGYCELCGQKAASERDHWEETPAGWVGGVCDRGVRHARNEDAMALHAGPEPDGFAVLVVCDGVSTAPDSDIASLVAARTALAYLTSVDADPDQEEPRSETTGEGRTDGNRAVVTQPMQAPRPEGSDGPDAHRSPGADTLPPTDTPPDGGIDTGAAGPGHQAADTGRQEVSATVGQEPIEADGGRTDADDAPDPGAVPPEEDSAPTGSDPEAEPGHEEPDPATAQPQEISEVDPETDSGPGEEPGPDALPGEEPGPDVFSGDGPDADVAPGEEPDPADDLAPAEEPDSHLRPASDTEPAPAEDSDPDLASAGEPDADLLSTSDPDTDTAPAESPDPDTAPAANPDPTGQTSDVEDPGAEPAEDAPRNNGRELAERIGLWRERIGEAVLRANAAIVDPQGDTDPAEEPSCTFVGAVVDGPVIVVGWVGDSRAYWLPDAGPAQQLTVDDSFAQQLVESGMSRERAETDPRAHAITRWLGPDATDVTPQCVPTVPDSPGWLLLCTDGLWNYCSGPERMGELVRSQAERVGGDPVAVAGELVRWANAQGGHDNVTAALARFDTVRLNAAPHDA